MAKRIDWNKVDPLIKEHLPNMTCVHFCKKYAPFTIPRTIGQRAKKLGITPKKYIPTKEHKNKTSKGHRKVISEDQIRQVKDLLNTVSRKEIAQQVGISLYLVNRVIKEHKLAIDYDKQKQFHREGSRKNVRKAARAWKDKFDEDSEFREKIKQTCSRNSRNLWESEEYRLKVRNGHRRTLENTDLRQIYSAISKQRYESDPNVRRILSAPGPHKTSKLNDTVATKLDGFGITYEREYELGNYRFDFKIGDILLEVHGNYWHSLPGNKRNDLAKATIVHRYYPQYKLRVIWESEIKSVRANDRLLEVLGIEKPSPDYYDLREVSFTDVPRDIDKFLISYHYLGTTNRKKLQFGLLLHDEVVAVAAFGQPVRQSTAPGKVLELTRLCGHPRLHNKNAMSFLLAKCEKHIRSLNKYDCLVSFADQRLHIGTVYRAANWKDMGLTASDYQYMSDSNIPMHKKTLYNRAVSVNMTERQYARRLGYRKVKIGKKRKFIKPLSKKCRNILLKNV